MEQPKEHEPTCEGGTGGGGADLYGTPHACFEQRRRRRAALPSRPEGWRLLPAAVRQMQLPAVLRRQVQPAAAVLFTASILLEHLSKVRLPKGVGQPVAPRQLMGAGLRCLRARRKRRSW